MNISIKVYDKLKTRKIMMKKDRQCYCFTSALIIIYYMQIIVSPFNMLDARYAA